MHSPWGRNVLEVQRQVSTGALAQTPTVPSEARTVQNMPRGEPSPSEAAESHGCWEKRSEHKLRLGVTSPRHLSPEQKLVSRGEWKTEALGDILGEGNGRSHDLRGCWVSNGRSEHTHVRDGLQPRTSEGQREALVDGARRGVSGCGRGGPPSAQPLSPASQRGGGREAGASGRGAALPPSQPAPQGLDPGRSPPATGRRR